MRIAQLPPLSSTYISFAGTLRATGSIVLKISYGYTPLEENDPFLKMVDDATEQAAEVVRPGGYMVDVFPIRKLACPSLFAGGF